MKLEGSGGLSYRSVLTVCGTDETQRTFKFHHQKTGALSVCQSVWSPSARVKKKKATQKGCFQKINLMVYSGTGQIQKIKWALESLEPTLTQRGG